MLRNVMTAGLILLGTSQFDAAAAVNGSTTAACHSACVMAANNQPSVRDAMDDGVARIAVRATAPSADAAPLTQRDLLNLYLLLSVQARTQGSTP